MKTSSRLWIGSTVGIAAGLAIGWWIGKSTPSAMDTEPVAPAREVPSTGNLRSEISPGRSEPDWPGGNRQLLERIGELQAELDTAEEQVDDLKIDAEGKPIVWPAEISPDQVPEVFEERIRQAFESCPNLGYELIGVDCREAPCLAGGWLCPVPRSQTKPPEKPKLTSTTVPVGSTKTVDHHSTTSGFHRSNAETAR